MIAIINTYNKYIRYEKDFKYLERYYKDKWTHEIDDSDPKNPMIRIHNIYNDKGKLIKSIHFDDKMRPKEITITEYNENGDFIRQEDSPSDFFPNGRILEWFYGKNNILLEVKDSTGFVNWKLGLKSQSN